MVNLKTLQGPQLAVKYFQYISPTRFGFAGLLQAQFPVTDTLSVSGAYVADPPLQHLNQTCYILPHFGFGKTLQVNAQTNSTGGISHWIDAESCADLYPNNFWMCVLGLFGTVILFRFLTIVILLVQECRCKKHKGDTRNMHRELAAQAK